MNNPEENQVSQSGKLEPLESSLEAALDRSGDQTKFLEEATRRVHALMKDGFSLEDAATQVGILRPGGAKKVFRDMISALIMDYHIPAEVMREMVRAARVKILLENTAPGGDSKIALDAAKQIASDPDVGLNAPPVPPVTINIGDGLKRLIETEPDSGLFEEEK